MPLDIDGIQQALRIDGLDGWLLYDFHGSNPIAVRLAGVGHLHTTRRWYYFIPSSGLPRKLVHAIEPAVLAGLPGSTVTYAGREQLETGVRGLLGETKVVAMEFSEYCAIPYISRVDAGTVDFVRALGVHVVSSGDLVGRFEAAWNEAAIATHRQASERLYRIKDQAFSYLGARLGAGDAIHEFEVQQAMLGWFREEGLATDAPPIVAAQENAGNPHYAPTVSQSRVIRPNELVLLDLWGKLDAPGAVYADITWTGFGGTVPSQIANVFDVVAAGRDAALDTVQKGVAAGEAVRGWQVDRAARDVITARGFGGQFIHRTGHSLGEEVHGNGVHMDDYETHDDRRLIAGTGFTIEPGVYLPDFGIRSEINVVVGTKTAEPTGPCQRQIVQFLSPAAS